MLSKALEANKLQIYFHASFTRYVWCMYGERVSVCQHYIMCVHSEWAHTLHHMKYTHTHSPSNMCCCCYRDIAPLMNYYQTSSSPWAKNGNASSKLTVLLARERCIAVLLCKNHVHKALVRHKSRFESFVRKHISIVSARGSAIGEALFWDLLWETRHINLSSRCINSAVQMIYDYWLEDVFQSTTLN